MDDKYPIHLKTEQNYSFERLEKLWERYPQFHEASVFTTLDGLLEEHESYQKDFDDTLKEEYLKKRYDRFLVQLSWSDLPYRRETKRLIEGHADFPENPYVKAFMEQFSDLSTDSLVTKRALEEGYMPMLYTNADYIASNACYEQLGYILRGKLCTVSASKE